MLRHFSALVSVCGGSLLAGLPVLAQDAPPSPSQPQMVTQTGLPAGVKRSETQVFGHWTVVCEDLTEAGAKRRCSAALHVGPAGSAQPVFSVIVGPDGKVENNTIEVIAASPPTLGEPAKKAVSNFKFKPGQVGGAPVRTKVAIPLVYKAQ